MRHPIFVLLTEQEWRKLVVLMGLTILLTVVELAGIGGAGLFIQIASAPESISSIPYAQAVFGWFGIGSEKERLLVTLAALLSVILLRNAVSIAVLWWRLRFLHFTRRDLATRLIRSYLSRPYSFFLRHNSAMMSKTILMETNDLVTRYLFSWITLVTDGLMLVATLGFLFYIEPVVTVVSGAVVGVLGFAVTFGLRTRMRDLGKEHRALNERMFKITNEAMAGVKEIKVLGREETFASEFHKVASRFAQTSLRFMLFSDGPRYLLEIIALVGFFIFFIVATQRTESMAEVAGLIGAFGFAVYRLLPISHRLVSAVGGLNFNRAIVAAMVEAIAEGRNTPFEKAVPALPMRDAVELKGVSYRYEGTDTDVFADITVRIRRNESVGIVGSSGAGKSTLVDMLIGLLSPRQGVLMVDGKAVEGRDVGAWQRNVGYVPQSIHLLDDTVRRNIAIGLEDHEIDDAQIDKAVASAQLRELIESLPDGLDTVIGERGIRLSGGQRQRIGIARALYHHASVLVLDEATSALDNKTEAAIRQSIERLKGELTLIVIAHRLTTVQACDRIIVMDAGAIVAEGDYATLEKESEHFRALVYADAGS